MKTKCGCYSKNGVWSGVCFKHMLKKRYVGVKLTDGELKDEN